MLAPARTLLTLALALATVGCASVDPGPAVTATARMLEERGVSGVEWRRDPAESDRARREAEELMRRPLAPADAGRLALLRSPDLQATLAELGVAQADLAQASRLANPGVGLSRLRGGGETRRTTGIAADVVDWLTQPLRRRLGQAELERAKLQVAAAIFDSVTAAQRALVDLQAAEAVTRAFQDREKAAGVAAEYARALHEAGNLTLRDRSLVEASWAEARAELEVRRQESERAREQLRRLLGLDGGESLRLAPLSAPPSLPASSPEELQEESVGERLDVAAARWAVDALERARRLQGATRWLPVGVELGVERESEGGIRLTGPTVELALPIFDSGRAARAGIEAELARARAQLAGLENRVRSEVREALAATASAAARIEILRDELVPARRRALELAVRESNQMLVGVFELLDARDELLEAEMGLLEATADAWRARIELLRALGR
ncbi:MAG: TolC family protein, partial [Thermoanaerobaculia bacterium]|nr:TolC family protein [Thermoanaerobaculia bacterium]